MHSTHSSIFPTRETQTSNLTDTFSSSTQSNTLPSPSPSPSHRRCRRRHSCSDRQSLFSDSHSSSWLGLTFCINYKLTASDLVSSWEVYYLNSHNDQKVKGSGAELSRRVQNLLTISRVQANGIGAGGSVYLPGSTKIHEQSLADMQEQESSITRATNPCPWLDGSPLRHWGFLEKCRWRFGASWLDGITY